MSYIAALFFVLGLITSLVSYGFFAWVGLAFAIVSWRRKEPRAYIALILNTSLLLVNFVSLYMPPLLHWEYLLSYSYFAYFLVFLFLFLLLVGLLLFGLFQLARVAGQRKRKGNGHFCASWTGSKAHVGNPLG